MNLEKNKLRVLLLLNFKHFKRQWQFFMNFLSYSIELDIIRSFLYFKTLFSALILDEFCLENFAHREKKENYLRSDPGKRRDKREKRNLFLLEIISLCYEITCFHLEKEVSFCYLWHVFTHYWKDRALSVKNFSEFPGAMAGYFPCYKLIKKFLQFLSKILRRFSFNKNTAVI